jgi:hypothetical protein
MSKVLTFLFVFFLFSVKGFSSSEAQKVGYFDGRISAVNKKGSLLRIKVDFANMKYVNKRDRVDFWNEASPSKRCKGYVIGKSPRYFLIKVPQFKLCELLTFINHGAHLYFFSKDLINNLKMGREVFSILKKKRLALTGQLETNRKVLETYFDKVDTINGRYQVLRDKLDQEWSDEISFMEEDRLVALRNYKGVQIRLEEIDQKLEKYRVESQNLKRERWALDTRLYHKK